MNIIKTICITIFLATIVYSSTGSVSGTIASEGQLLPGANVSLIGSYLGTVTDSVGNYFLSSIPTGKYILRVDYIGYESQTKEIYITLYDLDEKNETGSVLIDKLGVDVELEESKDILKGNALKNVNFELVSSALGLNEVVVSAAKVKQKITQAPSVISVMKEVEIRRQIGVNSYERLVTLLKGVDVTYFGVQGAQINARGFDGAYSTRFRQYEDGISMGELVSGQIYSHITSPPKESISKIEVLFGPQSALYGPDATMGILNIIKKHPRINSQNEINLSGSSLNKLRFGSRIANVYDKLAYDIVFEGSFAKELTYGNIKRGANGNWEHNEEYTDLPNGSYDEGVDTFTDAGDMNGVWDEGEDFEDLGNGIYDEGESFVDNGYINPIWYADDKNGDLDYNDEGEVRYLNSDYYENMSQNKYSLRSNFYYSLQNDSELSLSLTNISGTGYAMGSVGPMYVISNLTNKVSAKYLSNRHSLRYTIAIQNQKTIPRQNLARFQTDNPELSWSESITRFKADSTYWVMEQAATDHLIDYQWNQSFGHTGKLIAGFDYESKDPNTNRTFIIDEGWDYFLKREMGEDIKEYRYGMYAQYIYDNFYNYEMATSVRYDNHEYYGDMISPRFSIINNNILNGTLKLLVGKGFKAPTILERNLYSGIVDAANGIEPWPWLVQGIAMGNNTGFTTIDYYDIGNGQWDYIDLDMGIVGPDHPAGITSQEICEAYGGVYNETYNTCGNGQYDYQIEQNYAEPFIDVNYGFVGEEHAIKTVEMCEAYGGVYNETYNTCGDGQYDPNEPWWELDGNGIYDSGDVLIDSTFLPPLKLEEFISYEIAYMGMVNKNTLLDVNMYYGIYNNFKSALTSIGITGPWFMNNMELGSFPYSIREIKRGGERLGGHFMNDADLYTYVQTYKSLPVKIHYKGLDFGIKHVGKNFEISTNFSYFDDSDLVNKREKAEKYKLYTENKFTADSTIYLVYKEHEKYKDFLKVYSNTSNFKYNASITLFEPLVNNLNINISLKGNTPYDFVSGVFEATQKGKGTNYDPIEGYKIDGGRVGGGVYVDLNLLYKVNDSMNLGLSIKNLFESSTVSFPMSPAIPRSFVLETGYKF